MPKDHLYFYSKSKDVLAGFGINEQVADSAPYEALDKIDNWRQKLSNFWPAEIVVRGLRYATVEHCFQGSKLAIVEPDLGHMFSLDSDSDLSRTSGANAQAHRKTLTLNKKQLKTWNAIKTDIMYEALLDKFSKHADLKLILEATREAELWHGAGRTAATRQFQLEAIRALLKN